MTNFNLITAADLGSTPGPGYLVSGLIPAQATAWLYGETGSGCSLAALDIAAHIAAGLPWAGHDTTKGTVLYICADGILSIHGPRIRAWEQGTGHPMTGVCFLPEAFQLTSRDMNDLAAILRETKPALTIIDPLTSCTLHAEDHQWGHIVAACDQLRDTSGGTILAVDHPETDSDHLPIAIDSGADTIIHIGKNNNAVTVTSEKQRHGPAPAPVRLETVPCSGSVRLQPITGAEAAA